MIARLLRLLRAFIVCATFFAQTTVAWAQSEKNITPEQAKAMIVSFLSSPERARLGLRDIGSGPFRPASTYTPFADPRNGLIRLQGWRVDPVKRTAILPRMDGQVQASFVKDGERYVITDAREVEVSWITREEAKAMILRFLASTEAASLPPWVAESRKSVEAGEQPYDTFTDKIVVGPWSVDPHAAAVLLPTDQEELTGTFAREGKNWLIKNVAVTKVSRITPEEAKAMILRFLSTAQAATLPYLPKLRKIVDDANPAVRRDRTIDVGPWEVDPLTHDVRIIVSRSRELYGVFVKEGGAYSIFVVNEIEIRRMPEQE